MSSVLVDLVIPVLIFKTQSQNSIGHFTKKKIKKNTFLKNPPRGSPVEHF